MNDPNRGFPPGYLPGYYGYGPPPGMPPGPVGDPRYFGYGWDGSVATQAQRSDPPGLFEGQSGRFALGLLLGAGAAYLLTNEEAQQAAIRTAVRGWQMMRGSVEELKERFRDAEAELAAHTNEQ